MNVGQHITFGDTCFALVQKYREGRRTKADTVQRLVHVVSDEKGRVSPGRHEQVSDAFIAYFKMLDDFDREMAAAAREGPPLDEDQRGAEDVPEEQDPAPAVSKHARVTMTEAKPPNDPSIVTLSHSGNKTSTSRQTLRKSVS